MIQATSAWEYVANTKFLLNKSTPYHALNNYLMLLIKDLYNMVSIEKNSEIKNILGDSWARLTLTVWNCPGLDVGARIAQQWMVQILFEILFCKVIFTNDFPIKKIYFMTSFNESPLQ